MLYSNIHQLYLILIQPQCSILYHFNSTMNVLISGFLDMSDETFRIFNRTIKLEIHCSHTSLCTDVIKNSWSINKLLHFFSCSRNWVWASGYETGMTSRQKVSLHLIFVGRLSHLFKKAKKQKKKKTWKNHISDVKCYRHEFWNDRRTPWQIN